MSNIDMNLPSNSDASKKIVFSGKNLEASADDVIENVIVPALWDLLRESVHALWDRILDKSEDAPKTSYRRNDNRLNTNNGNYIPYGSANASKRSNLGRSGDFIDVVYFSSRAGRRRPEGFKRHYGR